VPRRKRPILTALGFILITGLLGALISATTTHLQSYASDFLTEDDKVAADINRTLDAADASSYPPCSDEDLTLLRSLAFHSPYIKDVGRKRDDRFLCSVMAGKIAHPVLATTHDFQPYGSHGVIYNVPIKIDDHFHGEIVASQRSNIILPPDIFDEFHRPPMFFSAAVIDTARHSMVSTYSNSPFPPELDLFLANGPAQRNGYLLFSQCAAGRPDCVLTGIALTAVWATNRAILISAILAGALIGIVFSGTALFMDSRHRTLASQLRRAIRRNHLTVVYQPIAEVRTNGIVGAEALVRWRDEDGDPVLPELFIAIAETHGFVGTITTFVLQTVIDDLGDLLRGNPSFHISVNMSAQDLSDPTFIPRLDRLLRVNRIPASAIGLELTERCTVDREHVIEIIRQLRSRGHIVYIDDFGTGYSSLSYLNELSVDVIKVDRAFTQTIGTNSVTASILPQILSMARALNLKIIVEGVEFPEQAEYLAQVEGQIHAQGWLFGEPLSAPALRDRVNRPS
jgi:sensor c-di-GMP phosphodiesterase-like protein